VVGQKLAVKGEEIDTEHGRVLRIEAAGPGYDELTPVPPPEPEDASSSP